ncbi:MAG: hypothetical protein R3B13_13400 [Polyangiaceae bacterium]
MGACTLLGPSDADLVGGDGADASAGGGTNTGGIAGSDGSVGGNSGASASGGSGGSSGVSGSGGASSGGASGASGMGATGGAGGAGGAASGGTGGSGTGGSPSIPTQSLVLWLRGDSGVQTESGGVVNSWQDQSGSGNHAVQATAAAKPTLGSLNGLPAIDFDGVDDHLVLPVASLNFSQGLTFFAITKSTTSTGCPAILQLSNGDEIDDISFQRDYQTQFLYEVSTEYFGTLPNSYPIATTNMATVVHSLTGNASILLQGVNAAGALQGLPASKQRSQNYVGRGIYSACAGMHHGLIAEILLYTRALAIAEQNQVHAYLQSKWSCCS